VQCVSEIWFHVMELLMLRRSSCVQKDKFLVYAQSNGAAVAFIVLLGSTVALAYNAVHNMLLKRTSSVAVRPMAVLAHL